ncbi:glutathione synthase [Auriscalpium vulgare]|uniref:Glutathione synthase n=1 Tax=Auriscalpium vulgare TaxID=40419 RepID=A0ACB8S4Q7_9AGAM|nr:glutathione synthase [Auriscalpium vulgare]
MNGFTSWPPEVTPDQLEQLTLLATTYALSHSLLYLPPHGDIPPPPAPASAIHAPLSLFPTPVPRELFVRARRIQRAYNVLYARVAIDNKFLDEIMGAGGVADVDEFTGELWRAWKGLREEGPVQPLHLGLFRSDYLLHQPTSEAEISLKQVEFNTISSSFGALSQQVSGLHSYLQASTGYFGASPLLTPNNLPLNETVKGLVAGLAEAHNAYGVPDAQILFVVQANERNIFDQRLLEYELLLSHGIHIIRRTLPELEHSMKLSPARALLLPSGASSASPLSEIAVVYYRAGYTPTDYPTPAIYATRANLERSRAIQCPSLALQLAGGKKIQQVLTMSGVLERYLSREEGADEVRESWVAMWGLDDEDLPIPGAKPTNVIHVDDVKEPKGTREARIRADTLVLKPQREGGGNNIYRAAILPFLDTLPAPERRAWIAMQLIRPPAAVEGYLVRSGDAQTGPVKGRVVSELGIFGWTLFGRETNGQESVREAEVGFLVRTKGEGVDEGGVAAGFSVLDSVLLVD